MPNRSVTLDLSSFRPLELNGDSFALHVEDANGKGELGLDAQGITWYPSVGDLSYSLSWEEFALKFPQIAEEKFI